MRRRRTNSDWRFLSSQETPKPGRQPVALEYLQHHHSPLTTHHSPLTTHHSPLTTHHSPLTTHHGVYLTPNSDSVHTPSSTRPTMQNGTNQSSRSAALFSSFVCFIWSMRLKTALRAAGSPASKASPPV